MMRDKIYLVLIMSLSVVLTLAADQALGGSRGAAGTKSTSFHTPTHPSVGRSRQLHRGRHTGRARHRGAFWPAVGAFTYGPAFRQPEGPEVDVTEPKSGDTHYTCTYDIPWDWVHRCPPFVGSSDPLSESPAPVITPIVPGCPSETVTVPRGNGKEQTVTIVRC